MTDPDLAPWFILSAIAVAMLLVYRRGTEDPAFAFMAIAVVVVFLAFVLFATPAPTISAEPRGAPVNAPVFADSASPVLHSVPGPDVSSGNSTKGIR